MAATDVRQVGINFGGQSYFESFPKLEKGGRISKRAKPNWKSSGISQETAAAEKQQGKLGVIVEEDPCWDSINVEEKTQETDQQERETPQKSNDEEREIQEKELEDVGFDDERRQKLDDPVQELDQEEKDGVVSATEISGENPQKSTHAVEEDVTQANPAEEKETWTDEEVSADGDDDYLFFGTFRTLIRRPKISTAVEEEGEAPVEEPSESEEREAPLEEPSESEEREIIQEKELEDVGFASQSSVDDVEITTSNEETAANQEEKEGFVSAIQDFGEDPQKPTTDHVEEGTAQEKETWDQESADERETTDQDLATAAVFRQEEEKQVHKIAAEDAREEEISFGGKNYDDHFPKIERKGRITKRERRGEFQN